jgi:hypothetical protein
VADHRVLRIIGFCGSSGSNDKRYVLHSTASVPHTVSRTAIGQVSKLDPEEEHVNPRGKTGGT